MRNIFRGFNSWNVEPCSFSSLEQGFFVDAAQVGIYNSTPIDIQKRQPVGYPDGCLKVKLERAQLR